MDQNNPLQIVTETMVSGDIYYYIYRKTGLLGFWHPIDFDKDAARRCNIYTIPAKHFSIEEVKNVIKEDYETLLKNRVYKTDETIYEIIPIGEKLGEKMPNHISYQQIL